MASAHKAPAPDAQTALSEPTAPPPDGRALRTLIAAKSTATLATYMIYLSAMVLVEEKTRASAPMGLMIFSSTVPGLLLALPAGALVDRCDRVRVLVTSNILRAVVAMGYALLTSWIDDRTSLLIVVYATCFAMSVINQMTASAEGGLLPRMAGGEGLMAANSVTQVLVLAAQGLGMAILAPFLLKVGDTSSVGQVAAIICAVAAVLCWILPRPSGRRARGTGRLDMIRLWGDIHSGLRHVAQSAALKWGIVHLTMSSSLVLVLSTLVPGWTSRVLGFPVDRVIYLAIPAGVGYGLGMWVIGRKGRSIRTETWSSIGLLGLATGFGLLAALRTLEGFSILGFLIASLLTGCGFSTLVVSGNTVLQETPPDRMRGRVISAQMFLSSAVSSLPSPAIGKMADVLGFQWTLSLVASAVLAIGIASARHASACAPQHGATRSNSQ